MWFRVSHELEQEQSKAGPKDTNPLQISWGSSVSSRIGYSFNIATKNGLGKQLAL